jgi:hypothetical protein
VAKLKLARVNCIEKRGGVNHLEVERPAHQFSTTAMSSLYAVNRKVNIFCIFQATTPSSLIDWLADMLQQLTELVKIDDHWFY